MMTSKRNDAFDQMKVKHSMSRKNVNFPCVLKSIIADTHRDNKTFTLNDKQIRSRLRAKFAASHVRNTSWIANNQREYDAIRASFDNAYATKVARPARKPRAKKVVAPETNDA